MTEDALRIRLALNQRETYAAPIEVLSNRQPVIIHGSDLVFEIFLINGVFGDEGTSAIDASNVTEVNVAVLESQLGGVPIIGKGTTTITGSVTLEDFEAGEPDKYHARITFSQADTQILASDETDETKWLCIYGKRGGGLDVFGCGPIRVFRPGIPSSSQTELTGAEARISDGVPQFLDGSDWYALTTGSVAGESGPTTVLTVSQTAFAGYYNASAVGLSMGTNNGQLWIRDGSDWRPCVAYEQDDVFRLGLSGSTTTDTPNGILSGTDYRVRNGRHECRRALNGYWYPIELTSLAGVRMFRLGPSYSIT